MKRTVLIISIFFTSLPFLHAQIEVLSVSYQSTENNTYKYEYYENRTGNKKVEVFNVYNPFEGQPGVELSGRSFTKITNSPRKLYDIVSEYLEPYLPALVRPNQTFFVHLKIGLDGKVGHVIFIHNQSLSFPVKVYEIVETAIKNEYKLTFFYDPNKIEGVYTVTSSLYYLYKMKKLDIVPEPIDPKPNQPGNPGRPIDTNPGAGAIP